MPLTPEEIRQQRFSSSFQGYERREVDSFLDRIAADYARATAEVSPRAEPSESLAREVGAVIRSAQESAERLVNEAQEEATATRQQAFDEAARRRRQAMEEAASILDEATEKVERLTHEAEQHANELRDSTRRKCEGALQSVAQRHEWLKAQEQELATRVQALDETFGKLKSELNMRAAGNGEVALPAATDEQNRNVPIGDGTGEQEESSDELRTTAAE